MPQVRDPAELGLYRRIYDDFTDKELPEEVVEICGWGTPDFDVEEGWFESVDRDTIRDLLEKGLDLDDFAKIESFKDAGYRPFILDRLIDVVEDAGYAIYDFFTWRKVKTSLTVLAGIGIGAGVGALLGTLVFPVIGTAIGGAVGAAITGTLTAVGGAFGLSILGAAIGSFFGKKTSDRLFKHEKRFQPSRRHTRVIKNKFNINTSTIDMMNGYLYNRRQKVESKTIKRLYKNLRNAAIKKAKPEAMEQMCHFFLYELDMLELELNALERLEAQGHRDRNKLELLSEIDAVKHILTKLSNANFPSTTRMQIKKRLIEFEQRRQSHEELPADRLKRARKAMDSAWKIDSALRADQTRTRAQASSRTAPEPAQRAAPPTHSTNPSVSRRTPTPSASTPKPGSVQHSQTSGEPVVAVESQSHARASSARPESTRFDSAHARNPSMLFSHSGSDLSRQVKDGFLTTLRTNGYEVIAEDDAHCDYRFQSDAKALEFHLDTFIDEARQAQITTMQFDLDDPSDTNDQVALIVDQAVSYALKNGNMSPIVMGGGDIKLAAKIYSALEKQGLSPKLNPDEFPTPKEQNAVLEEARKLAFSPMPRRPMPKVSTSQ